MRVLVGDESRCRKLVKRLRVMSQRSRRKMARLLLEARREEARKYGETKFGLDRFTKGFLDLITIWFISKFGKKPFFFF